MAHSKTTTATADAQTMRVISPTEAERLLGFFFTNRTNVEEPDIHTREGKNRRKNAVGNAFAVPVITRTENYDAVIAKKFGGMRILKFSDI